MKNTRESISPIKVVDSFNEATPEKRFFSTWKLMSQVIQLHNCLNEARASIVEINKFWKLSQYQLESSVETIISTFRGLIQNKDKEIKGLRQKLQEMENRNAISEKEMFNKCIRGSVLRELQRQSNKQEKEKKEEKQNQGKSKSKSSDYLQVLQKEVEMIKEKLALLDAQQQQKKLNTIQEVTQMCTSRQEEEGVKERYEKMLRQEMEEQYNFKEDLHILKNFNMESTKIIENEGDPIQVYPNKDSQIKNEMRLTKELKEIKQISKRFQEKDNKQNSLFVTKPYPTRTTNPQPPTQSSTLKTPIQLSLDFPPSPRITLASLSQVKPNQPNQTQQYIGNYTYTGSFDQNHQRHGYGLLKKNSKQVYVGNWKKGQFEGWGKLSLNTSKFVEYSGEFRNGAFDGRGTLVFRNGDKFIGEIVENRVNGEGTLHKQDGETLCGVWENNVLIKRY